MANIKSQIKRNRQNELRRSANRATRSALKTRIKQVVNAAETGGEDAQQKYRDAARALDKAAAQGVIHKNTAANKKSRLAKRLRAQ